MTTREQLAQRARGTPFEILYRKGTDINPPAPISADERKKDAHRARMRERYHKHKVLADNSTNRFCVEIASQAATDRTRAIAGRSL